jgi:predicted permease
MLILDAQYALRRFRAAPSFTAVAAITLALGIGSTTAIYSVIDALMLRPLPYANPERLIDLGVQSEAQTGARRYFDAEQLENLKARTDLFSSVDAFNFAGSILVGAEEPTQAAAAIVGGDLLQTLGVPPQLGRLIDRSDIRETRHVVLLSDALWRARFAADPSIVGRTIELDDRTVEVIGVMPPAFKFPTPTQELWLPFNSAAAPGIAARPMFVVARLAGDGAVDDARARVEGSTIDVRSRDGALVPRPLRIVQPLGTFLNSDVRAAIFLLAGAVGLVLLIACANIANLLLVQNAGRFREVAVRTALGASRGTLVRQFLVESAMLSIAGGALGLLVAQWFIDILATGAPEGSGIVSVNAIGLDARVVLFAIAATMVSGCLSGILPALKGARSGTFVGLQAGGRAATDGPAQGRMRGAFVVLQLAVSVVLLVGATLLARTFLHLTSVDPGFESRGLAIAMLELPRWRYPSESARQAFAATLVERVRALPGVTGAALSAGGAVSFGLTFEVEGRGVVLNERRIEVPWTSVDADYFAVMRIPIKAGRGFTAEDVRGAPSAIVISQALASRLWSNANPLGQRFRMGTRATDPWYTVVGVAGNVYQSDYAQTNGNDQLAFYLPMTQTGMGAVVSLATRTSERAETLLPLIRDQVRSIDAGQAVWTLRTGRMALAELIALPRFYTQLMAALAGLGLTIAAVGLYGVLSYTVTQRTREFGVRVALGAQKRDVVAMVLRAAGVSTIVGLIVGIAGSAIVTRWIESMLIDVPRVDPLSYVAASLLFVAVALAACWIPARRATRVDPIVALRYE